MALQLWETLKEAIVAYTGLSPATFFTVLALLVAVYHVASGLFGSSHDHRQLDRNMEEMQPLPPPVQLGEITEDELKQYDGSDAKKPLLMAIKGQIYDVSQGRMFYGPGGPYALFAGKDASRALAKMSFEDKDLTGDISGLGPFELEALQDWEYKFMSKYVKVGSIKSTAPGTEGESTGETAKAADQEATKPAEDIPSDSPAVKSEETSSRAEAEPDFSSWIALSNIFSRDKHVFRDPSPFIFGPQSPFTVYCWQLKFLTIVISFNSLAHDSSCRRITWSWQGSKDSESRLRVKFSSLFARRLGAGSHSSAGFGYKKMNGINVVAHKAVPGGPNPLHN
ncbi:membrane steroid-binding protein 2 [Pyrus ussuriensis x Pyrus communis]|uniref:Membrane steroid-binding protein 2 n=1 Tax=Pyrus ussuriensis x Pyrus communis TaxID=2448454 RepID=A0A5N5F123_9ROSA|nr:membrane steroid-binding protein 2 [Pyrus ussuriensis x Pyrus communis]